MALDDQTSGPLPCGVAVDDLIAQITEGAVPLDRAHQAACEYCQAALEAIRRAWQEFHDLARAAVTVPEDLAERVMRSVREISRRERVGALITTGAMGETRVADAVLARLARAAALAVPDVVWASVTPPASAPTGAADLRVAVRLVARYGPPLVDVAAAVRERVCDAVRVQTGVTIDGVDVTVVDVVVDEENF